MTQMTLQANNTASAPVLYMALELSKSKWKTGFEYGRKRRTVNVPGGDVERLREAIAEAKKKFKLPAEVVIQSCYEAGRDGFWLHRLLEGWGISNLVVDPASIEVSRRSRRTKTDRVDLEMLLSKLRQHYSGERVWKVVRVPAPQAEGGRHLHREVERLKKERSAQVNRLKGLLFGQGIRLERLNLKEWPAQVWGFGPLMANHWRKTCRESSPVPERAWSLLRTSSNSWRPSRTGVCARWVNRADRWRWCGNCACSRVSGGWRPGYS